MTIRFSFFISCGKDNFQEELVDENRHIHFNYSLQITLLMSSSIPGSWESACFTPSKNQNLLWHLKRQVDFSRVTKADTVQKSSYQLLAIQMVQEWIRPRHISDVYKQENGENPPRVKAYTFITG